MTKQPIPPNRKAAATLFCLLAALPTYAHAPAPKPDYLINQSFHWGTPQNRVGIVAFTGDNDRIANALSLYMQGKADYLLITGYEIARYENPAALAASLQINATRDLSGITFDIASVNTCDSAYFAGQWAKKMDLDFIVGVTSDYHARRTKTLLQQQLQRGTTINMWAVPTSATQTQWDIEAIKNVATQIGLCAIPGYQIPNI